MNDLLLMEWKQYLLCTYRDPCVIYCGVIQMTGVAGGSLPAVLVTLLVKIYLKHLITLMVLLSLPELISLLWRLVDM